MSAGLLFLFVPGPPHPAPALDGDLAPDQALAAHDVERAGEVVGAASALALQHRLQLDGGEAAASESLYNDLVTFGADFHGWTTVRLDKKVGRWKWEEVVPLEQ